MKYISLPLVFLPILLAAGSGNAQAPNTSSDAREFHVWATSCSHVPADIVRGRESLGLAIRQSEGRIDGAPAFDWDIMIDAGDLSASQFPPEDRDGMELQRQYRAMQKHRREQVYNVPGNHDAPYYDHEPGSWFRKWGDPLGEFTEFSGVDSDRRPFAVEGNWERYRFVAGNVLFLMLADRNDAPAPVGRGHSSEKLKGGYPPGAVTRDTFEWWKKQVLENQDKIIVTMHHHMLRDTTTASGYGEGNPRYHGSSGGAEGSSYLYFLIENDDPENFEFTADAHAFEDFLVEFEKANNGRGAIDFWIGGHTHMKGPEDDHGDKTISERRWGVNFLQAAALTKHHAGGHPLSRLLSFRDGDSDTLVRTYLHEAEGDELPVGFYQPVDKTMPLRHAFVAPPEIESMAPFPEGVQEFEPPFQKRVQSGSSAGKANVKVEPSVDLIDRWDRQDSGRLFLESQVEGDTENQIGNRPKVISEGAPGGKALEFDGGQRVRIGAVNVGEWTDLSVSSWVRSSSLQPGMRVVSKDRLGEPGCFMLLHLPEGAWTFRAWDVTAKSWRTATWHDANAGADDHWHHLVGVVDSAAGKTRLFVDGQLRAEASWSADTLDDSDAADIVVGADSGEERFGGGFAGEISDVRLLAKPLNNRQVAELFDQGQP